MDNADARLGTDERLGMRDGTQVRFGDFEYDFRRQELRRNGVEVRLRGSTVRGREGS